MFLLHLYKLQILIHRELELTFEPDEDWQIKTIFVNNKDVTPNLQGHKLYLKNIIKDQFISVVFEEKQSSNIRTQTDNTQISITDKCIAINSPHNSIEIYNILGQKLHHTTSSCTFTVPQTGLYIIKVGNRVFKIAI